MQNDPLPKSLTLYNPLKEDFVIEWLDDEDTTHTLTAKSLSLTTFPYYQGRFIRRHLADCIAMESKLKNHDAALEAAYKEIDIHDDAL